jgi:small subunit ribosomal protein S4
MFNTTEKRERSLGAKLFLKGSRCDSPKCALLRNPHRPGAHGKRRSGNPSEFKQQLQEKQKIKATYGIRESQMAGVVTRASKNPGITGQMIISFLERRLDNVVYRLGFTPSRSVARQMVNHGHFLVNEKKVTIPSYSLKIGDIVSIRPQSKNHPIFKDITEKMKRIEAPVWLSLEAEQLRGKVVSLPKDTETAFDVALVIDYYAK